MAVATHIDRQQRLDQIRDNGIVGAGGAGFPAHVKYQTQAGTFLVNAAECEPLLHKDQELCRHYPAELIEGARVAMELTGANEGIICIKEKYEQAIAALEPHLPPNMRFHKLGSYYPSGDEFIMIYEATGRIVPPGGLPRDVDCCVSNVETLINIARNRPVTHTYFSVAGAVENPSTLCVPVGTTMAECVAACGGATAPKWAILEGGVMMGKLREDPDTPVTKTTGGLVVLPNEHKLLAKYRRTWKAVQWIGKSACDQCVMCTELCPRYLIGHPIQPHLAMRALQFAPDKEQLIAHTSYCCECNICSLIACPEDLDPKNVCAHDKQIVKREGIKWKGDIGNVKAHPVYHGRRTPLTRIVTKLGLRKFSDVGPLNFTPLAPGRVTIKMSQHSGAPCRALVSEGQTVRAGAVIGRPPDGALGAPVHASIDGIVRSVSQEAVVIGQD